MDYGGCRAAGAASRGAAHQYAALLPFLVQIILLFLFDLLAGTCEAKCWTPGTIYSGLCDQARGNVNPLLNGTVAAALVGLDYTADSGDASSSGSTSGDAGTSGSTGSSGSTGYRRRRSLLWHGGGPEFLDGVDHVLGDNKRFRGDGGTLHDSDIGGARVGEPGTPDAGLVLSTILEDSFFAFVEGRAESDKTTVYGLEDTWYRDIFACDPNDPAKQMCEECGNHCNSWDWKTSGYSLLNQTELEIDSLFWMSRNVYISETILLPLSVCVQYDWWVCYRRLDENIRV